jgi:hypothetical protein
MCWTSVIAVLASVVAIACLLGSAWWGFQILAAQRMKAQQARCTEMRAIEKELARLEAVKRCVTAQWFSGMADHRLWNRQDEQEPKCSETEECNRVDREQRSEMLMGLAQEITELEQKIEGLRQQIEALSR